MFLSWGLHFAEHQIKAFRITVGPSGGTTGSSMRERWGHHPTSENPGILRKQKLGHLGRYRFYHTKSYPKPYESWDIFLESMSLSSRGSQTRRKGIEFAQVGKWELFGR